jgi:hypothetical protein
MYLYFIPIVLMASKRKAWDAAITAAAKGRGKAGGGGSGGKKDRRRDTRRRVKAQRWIATSDSDDLKRKVEARLEALEESVVEDHAEEEEYCQEAGESHGRKAKKQTIKKLKAASIGGAGRSGGGLPKKYRVKPLAQVLLDDHAAHGGKSFQRASYVTAEGAPSRYQARRLCVVTGLLGRYRDVSSGLSFSTRSAQAQLRETPPPWLQLAGNAPYFEALRYIKSTSTGSEDGDAGVDQYPDEERSDL